MATIVAVDPGLRECGVAVLNTEPVSVVLAFLAKNPEKESKGIEAWERMAHAIANGLEERMGSIDSAFDLLVVERQWIGFRQRSEGNQQGGTRNPSVVLLLAHVVGAIAMRIPAQRKLAILPSQWKGGSTKGRANKRRRNAADWNALTRGEQQRAEAAETYQGHNVKDSIGIGRWAAGRYRLLAAQPSFFFADDDDADS